MTLVLATCLALVGGADADSLVGKVRVAGSSIRKVVTVVPDGAKPMRVTGEALPELTRLQSIKVEVLGRIADDNFVVHDYRILDVGGGARPIVGILVETADGFGIRDGAGEPVALNMSPRSKRRLTRKVGGKVWVHGTKLVSGELKVLRYGILRDPPRAVAKPRPKPTPEPTEPAPEAPAPNDTNQ